MSRMRPSGAAKKLFKGIGHNDWKEFYQLLLSLTPDSPDQSEMEDRFEEGRLMFAWSELERKVGRSITQTEVLEAIGYYG